MYVKEFKVGQLERPSSPKAQYRRPWIQPGGRGGSKVDPDCETLATHQYFQGEETECTILECEDGEPIGLEN